MSLPMFVAHFAGTLSHFAVFFSTWRMAFRHYCSFCVECMYIWPGTYLPEAVAVLKGAKGAMAPDPALLVTQKGPRT